MFITIFLIFVIITLLLFKCYNKDNFENCSPSAPNVKPPDWYIPETYNINKWKTEVYPDIGSEQENTDSLSYRYWRF